MHAALCVSPSVQTQCAEQSISERPVCRSKEQGCAQVFGMWGKAVTVGVGVLWSQDSAARATSMVAGLHGAWGLRLGGRSMWKTGRASPQP